MTYRQPMEPREAFARLGRIKPEVTSLHDVFRQVVELVVLSIPKVTEASVTLVQGTDARTPAHTGDLALALDTSQYELGSGPCLRAASVTGVESITDMTTDSRWPDWTAGALRAGARSSLSIGLPRHASTSAALNLYATDSHVFDSDTIAVARAFAGYAGLALANDHLSNARADLARDVEAAMDSHAVVEQAKGLIMSERRCTPDEAFAVLTRMAQGADRTVRETAQALVDRTASG